jgi:hypothetical protein
MQLVQLYVWRNLKLLLRKLYLLHKNKSAIKVCLPGYWDFEHVGNALNDNE